MRIIIFRQTHNLLTICKKSLLILGGVALLTACTQIKKNDSKNPPAGAILSTAKNSNIKTDNSPGSLGRFLLKRKSEAQRIKNSK